MSEPPELWAFILTNTGLFFFSSILTVLSYLAYRRNNKSFSYATVTIGFGMVVLGGLFEPVYQLGVRGDYHLNGTELLVLQTGEGILIGLGLGLIFFGITQLNRQGPSTTARHHLSTAEEPSWLRDQQDGD